MASIPAQQQQAHDLHFEVNSSDGVTLQGSMDAPTNASLPDYNNNNAPRSGALSQSSHPMACIFHVLFKLSALFLYLFGGWFKKSGANFITVTVCCILLLAADFYVVKNITGRLLVGLRWWNQVEGESTKWIFESAPNRAVNKFDNSWFWLVLYLTPVVWFGLFITGLLGFKFQWLLTVCLALALSFANVYGYYKCSSDQKAKFQQMIQEGARQGAMSAIRHNIFGFLVNSATGTGSGVPGNTNVAANSTTYV